MSDRFLFEYQSMLFLLWQPEMTKTQSEKITYNIVYITRRVLGFLFQLTHSHENEECKKDANEREGLFISCEIVWVIDEYIYSYISYTCVSVCVYACMYY